MNKKGFAGLTMLLSVVVILFMIGLVVFVFTLMGGEVAGSLEQSVAPSEQFLSFQETPNEKLAWMTHGLGNQPAPYHEVNYTKPLDSDTALWRMHYVIPRNGLGTEIPHIEVNVNETIPTACFNADPNKLILRFQAVAPTRSYNINYSFECWDGGAWDVVHFYETASAGASSWTGCSTTGGSGAGQWWLDYAVDNFYEGESNDGHKTAFYTLSPAGISTFGCQKDLGGGYTNYWVGLGEESIYWNELVGGQAGSPALPVVEDTTSSIASVTTWFPIVLVITAMVVLILLTVLIIQAIRGSGLIQGRSA